jgi:hypothetical protein
LRNHALKIARVIWERIILPGHSWGVWETLGYLLCAQLIVDGFRYVSEIGFYVSFTGFSGLYPLLAYSYFLHCPFKVNENVICFNLGIILCYNFPFTLFFSSGPGLLAWVTTFIIFNFIGFSVIPFGLCYLVGFDSRETLERATTTSLTISVIVILIKILKISNVVTHVYLGPMAIMSTHVALLGFMIISNIEYWRYRGSKYMSTIVTYFILIMAYSFVSNIFGINGMRNTAYTYLVLMILSIIGNNSTGSSFIVVFGFFLSIFMFMFLNSL